MAIPWSSIPWDKVFAWAEKMFAQCSAAGVPPAEQTEAVRNPPPRMRLRLERVVERGAKANGLSAKEWRKNKSAIMARVYEEGKNATASEINQMRQRAKLVEDFEDEDDEDLF